MAGRLVPLHPPSAPAAAVTAIVVDADAGVAVSGAADGTLRVWSMASGSCEHVIAAHTDGVAALAVHAGGGRVLSAGRDRRVLSIEPDGARWELRAAVGRAFRIVALQASAIAHVAIARSFDEHMLEVVDVEGRHEPLQLRAPERRLVTAAIGDDGVVALEAPGALALFGFDGEARGRIEGAGAPARALAVDARRAWLGDDAGVVRVWDLEGAFDDVGLAVLACEIEARGPVRAFAVASELGRCAWITRSTLAVASLDGAPLVETNVLGALTACAIAAPAEAVAAYRKNGGSCDVIVATGDEAGRVAFYAVS